MPWQPTTIRRPDRAFPTATDTVRVTTDAGPGYLKALGNHGSPHYLAADLVGTRLAAWLGLPTFDLAIIDVTPEDEILFYRGGVAEVGPAFITREQSGTTWGGKTDELNALVNPGDILKLVLFDTWTRNCDRYRAEPPPPKFNRNNVFLSNEGLNDGQWRLMAMDHTHCFNCGRDLNAQLSHIELVQDERLYGMFPEFQPFVEPHRVALLESLAHMSTLNRTWLQGVVDEIPVAWQVSGAGKSALVTLLENRAQFVAENFFSWLDA